MLSNHKTNLNKSKRNEIIEEFFNHKAIKLEINNRYLENPQIFGN